MPIVPRGGATCVGCNRNPPPRTAAVVAWSHAGCTLKEGTRCKLAVLACAPVRIGREPNKDIMHNADTLTRRYTHGKRRG